MGALRPSRFEMALNRRDLKVISVIQLIIFLVFFILGLVDGLHVRFAFSSMTFTSIWLAILVLNAGIMGITLSTMQRPSLTLMNFLQSVCVTCAAISAITMYHYLYAWSQLVAVSQSSLTSNTLDPYFLTTDKEAKYTPKQKSMVTVSFLTIMFSIIEIILAVATIRTSDVGDKGSQEPQEGTRYGQLEAGQGVDRFPRAVESSCSSISGGYIRDQANARWAP
ncbi:uncharacterized protein LOC111337928 [Stylophora pistillata]|uniref:uncharacterized protein LOC111337928 n=1 Tax=Stylophora pistillata TaxID=50429 RepID=UPI000C053CD0|nr:uncharacterized protein LOC111337928 [Stylophora pistillata]